MTKHYTVKELPEDIRPYERFEKFGADALSNAELLAIIIRTGSRGQHSIDLANEILKKKSSGDGLLNLMSMSLHELHKIKGVGRVKAIQLKCVAELSRRISKSIYSEKLDYSKPSTIAQYYMEDFRHMSKEHVFIVMLDNKLRLIKEIILSIGTANASFLDARELFKEALLFNAIHICIIHNHPSGDPSPSREDIKCTKRLIEVGNLVGISVIDHIIIGDKKYISLREYGLL